jgi:glycosyltransferase involved in cell wall biosynthesis
MSRTEGNGKIADYLAMGLPVVAFDTPVSREMLGDAGIFAEYGSAADLAAKLELALEDRTLAQRLGAAGRERALAHFSWDRGAQRIEAIYDEVLARRARQAKAETISR